MFEEQPSQLVILLDLAELGVEGHPEAFMYKQKVRACHVICSQPILSTVSAGCASWMLPLGWAARATARHSCTVHIHTQSTLLITLSKPVPCFFAGHPAVSERGRRGPLPVLPLHAGKRAAWFWVVGVQGVPPVVGWSWSTVPWNVRQPALHGTMAFHATAAKPSDAPPPTVGATAGVWRGCAAAQPQVG